MSSSELSAAGTHTLIMHTLKDIPFVLTNKTLSDNAQYPNNAAAVSLVKMKPIPLKWLSPPE